MRSPGLLLGSGMAPAGIPVSWSKGEDPGSR